MPDGFTLLPLKHAPFLACLIDEGEEQRRADGIEDGDQNGVDVEGYILDALNEDLNSDQKSLIDWKNYEFQFVQSEPSLSSEDLGSENWSIIASGHPCVLLQDKNQVVRENSYEAWARLCNILKSHLNQSLCHVIAKRGSLFNTTYEHITPEIWQNFTVKDWINGTAQAVNGECLFFMKISFGCVAEAVASLNGAPDQDVRQVDVPLEQENEALRSLRDMIERNKRRPQIRRGIKFFYENYPNITIGEPVHNSMYRQLEAFYGRLGCSRPTVIAAKREYIVMRNISAKIKNDQIHLDNDAFLLFLDGPI